MIAVNQEIRLDRQLVRLRVVDDNLIYYRDGDEGWIYSAKVDGRKVVGHKLTTNDAAQVDPTADRWAINDAGGSNQFIRAEQSELSINREFYESLYKVDVKSGMPEDRARAKMEKEITDSERRYVDQKCEKFFRMVESQGIMDLNSAQVHFLEGVLNHTANVGQIDRGLKFNGVSAIGVKGVESDLDGSYQFKDSETGQMLTLEEVLSRVKPDETEG